MSKYDLELMWELFLYFVKYVFGLVTVFICESRNSNTVLEAGCLGAKYQRLHHSALGFSTQPQASLPVCTASVFVFYETLATSWKLACFFVYLVAICFPICTIWGPWVPELGLGYFFRSYCSSCCIPVSQNVPLSN